MAQAWQVLGAGSVLTAWLLAVVVWRASRKRRKLEVYRSMLEELARDGQLTDGDRAILDDLGRRRGVGADAAATVERDVFRAGAGAA